MVRQAIHEDEAIGEARERIPEGTLGLPVELRGVGQIPSIRFAISSRTSTSASSKCSASLDMTRSTPRGSPALTMGATAMERIPVRRHSFGVHPRVGFGVPAEQGHPDAHAQTGKAVVPGVTRSLAIRAQAADGTVDHDVSLDELNGGPIGVRHRLDPIEDEAHRAVGSSRPEGR